MATITTSDGVKLYYEEAGQGDAIVFVHEFGGHHLSWETQMRYFSRRYHCFTYQARGWPPSDVPPNVDSYSQARAADDIADVMAGSAFQKRTSSASRWARRQPSSSPSAILARASRSPPPAPAAAQPATPKSESALQPSQLASPSLIEGKGMSALGERYLNAPSRQQLKLKDPRGFAEFYRQFVDGASQGRALTMRGVQARRAAMFEREAELRAIKDPVLIVCGDEDNSRSRFRCS